MALRTEDNEIEQMVPKFGFVKPTNGNDMMDLQLVLWTVICFSNCQPAVLALVAIPGQRPPPLLIPVLAIDGALTLWWAERAATIARWKATGPKCFCPRPERGLISRMRILTVLIQVVFGRWSSNDSGHTNHLVN